MRLTCGCVLCGVVSVLFKKNNMMCGSRLHFAPAPLRISINAFFSYINPQLGRPSSGFVNSIKHTTFIT